VNYISFTLNNEDGDTALILFPVFVSILMVIGMGAAEFSNYFVTAQRVAYLARESSNLAITKCWDVIYQEQSSGEGSNEKTNKCLNDPNLPTGTFDVRTEILGLGKDLIKTFDVQGVIKIHIWIKKNDPAVPEDFPGEPGNPSVNPTNPDESFTYFNFTKALNDKVLSQDPLIEFKKIPTSYFDEDDNQKTSKKKKKEAQEIANEFHRIAIAEAYYTYVPITPLHKIMGLSLPYRVREISAF
jgi:hypothetical protein